MTGALKARTATSPDVWTPVGSTTVVSEQTLASNAETIAGVVDDKAVTPAGLAAATPEFDVRNFGAVGDGVTNDQAAITAALAAAPAGSIIDLAGRTYLVTALTVSTAVTVRNGALVGTNRIVVNVAAAGTVLQNLSITRDITWNGVDAGSGVYVNADRVRVENCNFTNAYSSCLAIADGINDVTVIGGTFSNTSARQDASAIYVAAGPGGHQRIHIDRVRVTGSASQGIAMYNCSDSSVSRSSVSSCRKIVTLTMTGWTLVSGSIYSTTERTDGSTRTLRNNTVQVVENTATPTTPGSSQWGTAGGVLYVNLAGTDPNTRTMTSDIVSGYGIYFYDANGNGMYRNRITDCNVDDCDGFGLYVVGTGADMKISGCALRNVALQGSQNDSLPFGGIGLGGGATSITNCSVDTAGSVGKVMAGVRTDNGTFKLTNVVARNCTGAGFSLWGDVTAVNCEALSNTGQGFAISPTATATTARLIGCRSVSNASHGIDVSPTGGGTGSSIQIIGGYVANNTLRGVLLGTASDAVVEGVNIYNNGGVAQQQILVQAGVASATIIGNRVGHTSATAQGIVVQAGATDTTLTGNIVNTITTNAYTVSLPVKLSGSARTTSHWQGAGTPETFVTANVGSTYHRTDGGALTSFYVKETGTAATGWVAK